MVKIRRKAELLHDPFDIQERGPSEIGAPPTQTSTEVRSEISAALLAGDLSTITSERRQEMYENARRLYDHGKDDRWDPRPDPDPVVYYLRLGNRIKIGFSTNVRKRASGLGVEEILATEPGSFELEKQRHREFVEYRVTHEWFEQGPRLLEHIVKLRGGRA